MRKNSVKFEKRGSKAAVISFIIIVAISLVIFGALYGTDKYRRSVHPLMYTEFVEKYSDEYSLDKYLVYSFILTESGFDPNSESYLGARGLMQIMPETFEWIRYRLGEDGNSDITYDLMYDAEENIRYGCYLLSYLCELFPTLTEVAAAYHAGAGSVEAWLLDESCTENGRLTSIPNSDTAHYVDKITNAYSTYLELYSEK